MTTRDPIVAGVDGTAAAGWAPLEWAAREAERRDRPLRVLYAFEWDRDESRNAAGSEYVEAVWSAAESVTATAVRRARELAPTVAITSVTLIGQPTARLLEIADDTELMVLGHRGHGGFAGLPLGSVSRRVATQAPCPVVVVRGRATAGGPVVAGVGDSPAAEQVLRTAFEAAADRGCALVAIRSCHPPIPRWNTAPRAGDQRAPDPDAAERARLEHQLAPWRERHPGLPVETVITHDSAASALVGASARAQLVVVGSRGRGVVRGALLGSALLQLLQHANCPVLIARERTSRATPGDALTALPREAGR